MDLTAERYDVRQAARRNTFTGKTYNSVENISQFFGERGHAVQRAQAGPAPQQPARRPWRRQLPRPAAAGQATDRQPPPPVAERRAPA